VVEPPSIEDHAKQLLRDNVARLMADSSFTSAAEVLGRVRRDTFKDLPLVELLPLLACLAIMTKRKSSRRETWEKFWPVGTGKTLKALKDFPRRIRGIADEVERVNSNPFFNPSSWITKETTDARIVRRRFTQLPGLLCLYATSLELLIGRLPSLTAQAYPPPTHGHSDFVFLLSGSVKMATGRFRDREVAELLNAAALALGEDYEFDALTLAQARSRRRATKVKT
jgi:hypothetical protein